MWSPCGKGKSLLINPAGIRDRWEREGKGGGKGERDRRGGGGGER